MLFSLIKLHSEFTGVGSQESSTQIVSENVYMIFSSMLKVDRDIAVAFQYLNVFLKSMI